MGVGPNTIENRQVLFGVDDLLLPTVQCHLRPTPPPPKKEQPKKEEPKEEDVTWFGEVTFFFFFRCKEMRHSRRSIYVFLCFLYRSKVSSGLRSMFSYLLQIQGTCFFLIFVACTRPI